MSWSPNVTVAAVIRRGGRHLLVEERPEGRTVLNQPAGHLEYGESLLAAIRREVLEETGREFTAQGLVGAYQWTVPGTDRTYLRFCFAGEVGERIEGSVLDPDIVRTHWLTPEQIEQHTVAPLRSPLVLRCIADAQRRPPLPLDALHVVD